MTALMDVYKMTHGDCILLYEDVNTTKTDAGNICSCLIRTQSKIDIKIK